MNLGTAPPLVRWSVLCALMGLTKATPLHPVLPPKLRGRLLTGWTPEMYRVAFSNLGQKMFLDMPCNLPDPPSFRPLVDVAPEHRFSEDDVRGFYERGFIGPITVFTPEEMGEMRRDILAVLKDEARRSLVYQVGQGTTEMDKSKLVDEKVILQAINGRDRHIDRPEIWKLVSHAAITERLAQLLGPDLLVWRSQFFDKPSGAPAIDWHAASVYLSEALHSPVLYPPDINRLFQLTTWMAIDDADQENGCMEFMPGTHRRFVPAVFGSAGKDDANGKFVGLSVRPDLDDVHDFPLPAEHYTSGKVVPMPLKAGQCVIFTERCIHGSGPNRSPTRDRTGITFRTIQPDVGVYGGRTTQDVSYFNSRFDLSKWGAIALRGHPVTTNRLVNAPVLA